MKIDLTKFKRTWYEDANRNVIDRDPRIGGIPDGAEHYWSVFPCQLSEELSHVGYHPEGIQKLLIKIPVIGDIVKRKIGKTFRNVGTFHTTYCKLSQDCIVKMVTSGDYTLEQAIWVMTKSCERCGNALIYKYLDGVDGYAEDSDEYKKETTRCLFCNHEQ